MGKRTDSAFEGHSARVGKATPTRLMFHMPKRSTVRGVVIEIHAYLERDGRDALPPATGTGNGYWVLPAVPGTGYGLSK